jgi:hypothetical protein
LRAPDSRTAAIATGLTCSSSRIVAIAAGLTCSSRPTKVWISLGSAAGTLPPGVRRPISLGISKPSAVVAAAGATPA